VALTGSVVAAGVFAWSATAYCDGNPAASQPRDNAITTRQYNDRLPPVMPGEEIVTETGQKMKVWSSTGPVPVTRRPPQQVIGGGVGLGGVGVVVDGRDRHQDGTPHDGVKPIQPVQPLSRGAAPLDGGDGEY